jgi:hypothetical protein
MRHLRIDQVLDEIERSFGPDLPFLSRTPEPAEIEVLNQVFGDHGYQDYLQDQINRQVIRDYLSNAVRLDTVSREQLQAYHQQLHSSEGRALLALHMVMSSVEDANSLPLDTKASRLCRLEPDADAPPHMEIVPK